MRLPFTTNLDLYGNTQVCVRRDNKRRQAPRHISPPGRNFTLSACESQGIQHILGLLPISWKEGEERREVKKASKPFIMFSPKQLLCQQTWLLVGKSVISTLDLSNTSPLWLSRFNNSSCHWAAPRALKYLGGLYPKVVDPSEDMSDSRTGLHLLVKRPFLALVWSWKISLRHNFGLFLFF